ncbi:hypothetical protein [Desulfolutivibrio sulfoxidireducens]|uniref:hypothetical protein n=1 Tax=Desulfolutivibrio sulfoxidireducens TaxID=2773299 RepID=UPI00159EACE4|nr:hypothetical protein [Desulfolutivibrio sulfoxidireducens]QLA19363.1 hypothetical protein GD604_06185 [Desulfolutivibrio sulfoxidireducens]
MSKGQTPTSSEKLLRLIRGANAAVAAGRDEARARGAAADKPRRGVGRFMPVLGARAVVGVDVGRRGIFVAALRRRDGDFEVLALERAEFDASVGVDSEEFSRILASVLSRATLNVSRPEIWCSIASGQADMRLIGVPKVPSSQRDNAVFWTARKELSFDEKAVIFDFEDRGEVVDKGAVKLSVFVHTIPRDEVARRKTSFLRAGYPLTGMTLPPFADQNVFRSGCLPSPPGGSANLYVGSNWSRLEIFRDGNLVFTRGIKAAMSALAGAIQEGLAEESTPAAPVVSPMLAPPVDVPHFDAHPAEVVLDLDDDGQTGPGGGEPGLLTLDLSGQPTTFEPLGSARPPEAPAPEVDQDQPGPASRGVTEEDAAAVLLSLVEGGAGLEPGRPGHGLSAQEIIALADPALSRLARQVEMTLKHYRETLGNDPVGALYVSGQLAAAPAFLEYLEGHLGIPCEAFDPLGASEIRRPGSGVDPDKMSLAERCRYQQALGVALSRSRMTPNCFVTYKERREARRVSLVNRAMVGVFCLILALLVGAYAIESGRNQAKTLELGRLREQIAGQAVMVDTAFLQKTAEEAKKTQDALRAFATKNFGLGVIGELSTLTPKEVRLLNLTLDMGPPAKDEMGPNAPGKSGKPSKGAKPAAKYIKKIILDGVVEGDSQVFESVLAGYLVNLQNSPLFGDSTVSKRDVETISGGQALHFVVSLALTDQ